MWLDFAAPVQKALQIVLVRDITGAQFWGALSESLQPRLKAAKAGEAGDKALSELGKVFQTRPLTNGMSITLNWIHPSTLQVSFTLPMANIVILVFNADCNKPWVTGGHTIGSQNLMRFC